LNGIAALEPFAHCATFGHGGAGKRYGFLVTLKQPTLQSFVNVVIQRVFGPARRRGCGCIIAARDGVKGLPRVKQGFDRRGAWIAQSVNFSVHTRRIARRKPVLSQRFLEPGLNGKPFRVWKRNAFAPTASGGKG
jgi:hypothetical protein